MIVSEVSEHPALAPNVQLLGEMPETGFSDRQWLIQRDGRFIQLSELLYRVAECMDGRHSLDEIAANVTAATDWSVSGDHIRVVIQSKLMPMGLVSMPDRSPAAGAATMGRASVPSPLMLSARTKVIGPRIIDPIARALQFLYLPPIVILVVAAIAAVQVWLFFIHGMDRGVLEILNTPGLLLVVVALLLLASAFHEFGHAAALRYGGGRVRGMGIGLYLIFPALYTDVTESYRLGRWARVRTDLGGFYFYLVFSLGIVALYHFTRQEFLLLVVLLLDVDIVRQIPPFVRFDGYWAFADLTGIPDPLSMAAPFLRSLSPRRGTGERLPALRPWARRVYGVYILATLPVLGLFLLLAIKALPYIVTTTAASLLVQMWKFAEARSGGSVLLTLIAVVQIVILTLPVGGIGYALYLTCRRWLGAVGGWTGTSPPRRLTALLVNIMLITVVAWLWAPQLSPAGSKVAQAWTIFNASPAKPIDGIHCNAMEEAAFHVHAHLTILDRGRRISVPAGVGIKPSHGCLYWLHTHDTSGIIHIEAPHAFNPTLGNFFDIWGQSLSRSGVTDIRSRSRQAMRVYVNGRRYAGSPRSIPLRAHTIITIEIGPPFSPPQPYYFEGL